MAKYRRIAICMWGDEKFQSLSKPKPNAQTLWVYLLTGEHTLAIPGLSHIGEYGLAEALKWPISAFRRTFKEITDRGMVKADFTNRVVWLPHAVQYNPPDSVNVVKAWAKSLEEIPECRLKIHAAQNIVEFLRGMDVDKPEAFAEAFAEALPKGLRDAIAEDIAYQEQEQEQEQDIPPIAPQGADARDEPSTLEEKNFELARVAWPGKKRGFRTEFETFRKHHKDWRELLDDDGLAGCVKTLIERKAYSPGWWPMFATWTNENRYEEALQPPEARK